MSWQRVASLALLIGGGIGCLAFGAVPLAAGLFGAAAGAAVPAMAPDNTSRQKRDS